MLFLFFQWYTSKALWVKLLCPHVTLLAVPSVLFMPSKLRVQSRWLFFRQLLASYECFLFALPDTEIVFHITGTKRHQTTAVRGPQQNRKGIWLVLLMLRVAFFSPLTLSHLFCHAVVHSSVGGGRDREDENHCLVWSRRKKVDGKDPEEGGAHLLPAATPRSPVSYTHPATSKEWCLMHKCCLMESEINVCSCF